jgi:hypothetical protein
MVVPMSTEQTESTTRLPAVPSGGSTEGQSPAGAQPTAEQPAEWGAPPAPASAESKSKWTVKRTVIAVAVAVGIAAAGGAAIYAASGSVDNTQGGPGGGGPGGMGGGPGNGRMMGGMGAFSETQHGEFQTGEVTAISDDSITAKSEDGYEQTYVINSDTQLADGIETGDTVTIIAATENDTATATSVLEFGTMPNGGQGNNRNGGNGTPPSGGNGTPPTTN